MERRTRKPRAQRREEIARAILRIIGEEGLAALTTTALAREVGVTSGALFRHFASRDEMLQEAVHYALPRIESTFPDESVPPVGRLIELARNRVRVLGSDPGMAWLLRSEQAYLSLPEEAVQQLRDLVQRSRQFLLNAIREGRLDGTIRSDIDPHVLLVPVLGTIHGLIGLQGVHGGATRGLRIDSERVLSALELLLAPAGHAGVVRRTSRSRSQRGSRKVGAQNMPAIGKAKLDRRPKRESR